VNGNVLVNAGGTMAPGSSTAITLTVGGNLMLNTNSVAFFWLNLTNAAGANSSLTILGTQSITGATLTVSNLGPAIYGGIFKLLSNTNNVAGFTTVNLPPLPAGRAWTNNLSVDGTIQVLPVTLYVSPTGSDTNAGTNYSAPLQTLAAATAQLGAGDTLYLLPGTYRETMQPTISGLSNAPITIAAYNGATVTISACDLLTNWSSISGPNIYNATVGWDLGEGYNEVFVDGGMQHEAQFPVWTATNWLLNPGTVSVTVTGSNSNIISSTAFNMPTNYFVGGRFVGGVGTCYGWQSAIVTNSGSKLLIVDPTTEDVGWWTNTGSGFVYGISNLLFTYAASNLPDANGQWFLQTDSTGTTNTLSLLLTNAVETNMVELKHRNWCVNITNCNYITVNGLNTCGGAILLSGTGNALENVNAG